MSLRDPLTLYLEFPPGLRKVGGFLLEPRSSGLLLLPQLWAAAPCLVPVRTEALGFTLSL